MNVKQEHLEIDEHDIQTENKLSDMVSIFESQVSGSGPLISADECKLDILQCKVPTIEQRLDLPLKTEHVLVDEQIQFDPTTVKQEFENTTKVEDVNITDMKQEVCDYDQFKNETELLTSHIDLPTLKSDNNDYPDYSTQSCSNELTQQISNPFKNCPADDSNCSQLHPCIVCQENCPPSQSGLNQIDGYLKKDTSLRQLSNEDKNHSNEKLFECNICLKGFDKEFRLMEHLADHIHELKCATCSKGFTNKSRLQKHLRTHTQRLKCDICSKEFTRKFNFKVHLKIHTNEKQFKCKVCSKEFIRKQELERHVVIHNTEKPFKCILCSKEFKRISGLQNHVLTMHPALALKNVKSKLQKMFLK